MIIETKYSIGDVVWLATTRTETKRMPCPDCNGTKKWKATSPAGAEYEFNCPRCSARHGPNHPLTLDYTQFTGSTQRLTVGQVRTSTGDEGATYMCCETGVGSGSIYYERDLFLTKEEAQAAADAKAAVQNDGAVPWVKKQYDEVLALCDYELTEARSKQARDGLRDLQYKVGYFLDDLEDAVAPSEVKELVKKFRQGEV